MSPSWSGVRVEYVTECLTKITRVIRATAVYQALLHEDQYCSVARRFSQLLVMEELGWVMTHFRAVCQKVWCAFTTTIDFFQMNNKYPTS
jgi:hypothetical protein